MINMIAIRRRYININWSKMQVTHNKICASHVKCMKEKWNPFRDDWEQGFDSDCFGHCSEREYCSKAFYDHDLYLDNHLEWIVVEFENRSHGVNEEIELLYKGLINCNLKLDYNEKRIATFEKCPEKSRCNCFNEKARYICSDASLCSLIYYYKNKIEKLVGIKEADINNA